MQTVSELVKVNGGVQAVADRFKVSRAAVYKWCRQDRVPARKMVEISKEWGTPLDALRPDIFGQTEAQP